MPRDYDFHEPEFDYDDHFDDDHFGHDDDPHDDPDDYHLECEYVLEVDDENDDWDDLDEDEQMWREGEEAACERELTMEQMERAAYDSEIRTAQIIDQIEREIEQADQDAAARNDIASSIADRLSSPGRRSRRPRQETSLSDAAGTTGSNQSPNSPDLPKDRASDTSWWLTSMMRPATVNKTQTIELRLVGVTQDGRQLLIRQMKAKDPVVLRREPDNPYDTNAIAVYNQQNQHLGYLAKIKAAQLASRFDRIGEVQGEVVQRLSATNIDSHFGLLIRFHLPIPNPGE